MLFPAGGREEGQMPTAADKLKKDASDEEIATAISECISEMAHGHPDWENARRIEACYSMAEKATGRKIRRGRK